MTLFRILAVACLMLGLTAATGCTAGAPTAAPPSFCDGIDASLGGCDPDRPRYSGTSCAAVGQEFGRQLNDRLLRVFTAPEVVDGNSRAVRAGHVTTVAMSLANLHLRRIGLIGDCGASEFMEAAEIEFTPALRAQVGRFWADGVTISYEEWRVGLRDWARILDLEEAAPVPSSSV